MKNDDYIIHQNIKIKEFKSRGETLEWYVFEQNNTSIIYKLALNALNTGRAHLARHLKTIITVFLKHNSFTINYLVPQNYFLINVTCLNKIGVIIIQS